MAQIGMITWMPSLPMAVCFGLCGKKRQEILDFGVVNNDENTSAKYTIYMVSDDNCDKLTRMFFYLANTGKYSLVFLRALSPHVIRTIGGYIIDLLKYAHAVFFADSEFPLDRRERFYDDGRTLDWNTRDDPNRHYHDRYEARTSYSYRQYEQRRRHSDPYGPYSPGRDRYDYRDNMDRYRCERNKRSPRDFSSPSPDWRRRYKHISPSDSKPISSKRLRQDSNSSIEARKTGRPKHVLERLRRPSPGKGSKKTPSKRKHYGIDILPKNHKVFTKFIFILL